jgi:hypothetical protein
MSEPKDRKAIAKMIRMLLREAREIYMIYGRLLQGPGAIEKIEDHDLEGLVELYERWRDSR